MSNAPQGDFSHLSTSASDSSLGGPSSATSRSTPTGPRLTHPLAVAVIIIASYVFFVWHVEKRGLWSAHEGRAAQNAQRMIDDGTWVVPQLYIDEPDLQKPPMYYWMVAGLAELQGGTVDAWSVRAPSVISAMLCLLAVYLLGSSMWNRGVGLAAAGVLLTTTRFAWLARVGRIDMPMTLVIVAALGLFWMALPRRKPESSSAEGQSESLANPTKKISWFFYIILAFGLLLKGPVVLVMVGLPIVIFLALLGEPMIPLLQTGAWKNWKHYRVLGGGALLIALAGPWFLYAGYATDGVFLEQFFVYHNIERALGTNSGLKSGPSWFYIPHFFVDSFPWCVLVFPLALTFWHHRHRWNHPTSQGRHPQLFLMCWACSHFVFLSIIHFKRADYLLPMLPAVALLLAGWLYGRGLRFRERLSTRPARNPVRRSRLILASAFALLVVIGPLMLWGMIEFLKKGVVKSMFQLSIINRYMNETDRFMLDNVELLLRENWSLLGICLVVALAGIWLLHTGWHHRRVSWIVSGLALPWAVGFLFHVHVLLPALDPLREMSRFGEEIRSLASTERPIYYLQKFDADLVFHARRPARMLYSWDELAELGQDSQPAFVVIKAKYWKGIKADPRMAMWVPVHDNRQTAFGDHRDPRMLITNRQDTKRPGSLADRPRSSLR